MSDVFPLPRAELIALFLESLIFGAFCVLYAIAIWILLYREKLRSKSFLNKMLFTTSSAMFVLSVVHLCLDVQRALAAFVENGDQPNGALNFYSVIDNPTLVAKNVIFISMTLLGDSFVSYRLWIVWNRAWWIVVIPCMLLVATAIAGYGACYEFTQTGNGDAVFASNLRPWILSFFCLSMTTNVLATLLIAARIVYSNRRVRQFRAGVAATSQWDVIETLVQSAALYSVGLASLLGTYVANSNAQYVCLDALQPLIGVVFTLIIIRVGLGYTVDETSAGPRISDHRGAAAAQSLSGNSDYPLRPVAINVSVSRTHDRASLEIFDRKDNVDLETGTAS